MDPAPMTAHQLGALQTTERVASCFSLIGTTLIFVTFASSPNFRKPINRLIFFASWGNTLCNIGTMISESGVRAGQTSHLCQFQAFLIQMYVSLKQWLRSSTYTAQVRPSGCSVESCHGDQCLHDTLQEVQFSAAQGTGVEISSAMLWWTLHYRVDSHIY